MLLNFFDGLWEGLNPLNNQDVFLCMYNSKMKGGEPDLNLFRKSK